MKEGSVIQVAYVVRDIEAAMKRNSLPEKNDVEPEDATWLMVLLLGPDDAEIDGGHAHGEREHDNGKR